MFIAYCGGQWDNTPLDEFDDESVSTDSQTDGMDHNELNDIIDSQLNTKENDDDDDD